MKLLKISIGILVLVLACDAGAVYELIQADPSGYDGVRYDAGGTLGIMFSDGAYQTTYRTMQADGTTQDESLPPWSWPLSYGGSGLQHWCWLLGYDAAGLPHCLARTSASSSRGCDVSYRMADGTWVSDTVISPSNGTYSGEFKAAVQDNGAVHVLSYTMQGSVTYYYKSGGVWLSDVVYTAASGEFINSAAIAVDSSGRPHIAYNVYFDYDLGLDLRYAQKSTGGWIYETVRRTQDYGNAGTRPSIAMMPNGQPAIASTFQDFHDVGGSIMYAYLQYSTRTGADAWHHATIATHADNFAGSDGSQYTGYHPHLAFDGSSRPHIVFSDLASSHFPLDIGGGVWVSAQSSQRGQIRHAYHNGAGWQLATLYRQTHTLLPSTTTEDLMVLEDFTVSPSGGRLHILGYDNTHGNLHVVAGDLVPPAATTPVAPTGALVGTVRPDFSWLSVTDASWYYLWIARNGSTHRTKWRSETNWLADADFPSGNYSWWVQTYNAAGYGPWSTGADFSIAPYSPEPVAVLSPTGTVSHTRRPLFGWTAADRATWHHIWVNRVGEGKYAEKWVEAPATTWLPDADFSGGDYKWWIAGWNADGYGDWSSGTPFSIPVMQPEAIVLGSPTGGVSVATGSVAYQWDADERATWYELWCGRNGAGFADNWYRASVVVSGATATASISNHNWGAYAWYVRGWGPDGMGPWSTAGEFTCGEATPVSASATLLTWDDTQTASAGWYNASVKDAISGATERAWWFSQGETSDAGGGNRSKVMTPALTTGNYEWSIRAWSGADGLGPWSDPQEFVVP